MKYGYSVTGNGLYIPWFDEGNGRQNFKSKHVKGVLRNVAQAMGNMSAPRRWSDGQWLLDPFDKKVPEEEYVVFFTSPIYVCAFIGAARHWLAEFRSVEISE